MKTLVIVNFQGYNRKNIFTEEYNRKNESSELYIFCSDGTESGHPALAVLKTSQLQHSGHPETEKAKNNGNSNYPIKHAVPRKKKQQERIVSPEITREHAQ